MGDERTALARIRRKRERRYLRRRLERLRTTRALIKLVLASGATGNRARMRGALNVLVARCRESAERLWAVDYPSRHPKTSPKWRRRGQSKYAGLSSPNLRRGY